MGVYLQGHVHGAVPGQVLDLLDVQPRLEQPGDVGVPEDVGRHMGVGQLPLHQVPHTLVGGLGEGLAVLHGQHDPGTAGLPALQQPFLQLLGERQIPAAGFRLEGIPDGGLSLADDGVMPDVNDPLVEVDVLPHKAQDLAPAHPCMEGNQQERVGSGVLYPLHQETGLLGRQGHLLGGLFAARLQHTTHRGFGYKAIFLCRLEDTAQVDQHLGLQGIALVGQGGHDGLDLHRTDVPQTVATNVGQDVLVQNVLDGVEAILPQVGLFIEVVPHLGEVAEGLLTANVHARVHQDLGLQHLFVKLRLGLGPDIFPGAVRELDGFGQVVVFLFRGCFCHLALSFQQRLAIQHLHYRGIFCKSQGTIKV